MTVGTGGGWIPSFSFPERSDHLFRCIAFVTLHIPPLQGQECSSVPGKSGPFQRSQKAVKVCLTAENTRKFQKPNGRPLFWKEVAVQAVWSETVSGRIPC